MEPVKVIKRSEFEAGWHFTVEVGVEPDRIGYAVFLDKDYYQKLTGGKRKPEELVHRSFLFLLQREAKTAILRSFNLHEISYYYSKYEEEIKRRMHI